MKTMSLLASRRTSALFLVGVAAVLAHAQRASATVDGTLSVSDGYTLLSTQTNVTASPSQEPGGPGGVGNEVAAGNTAPLDQLSNAYGTINASTNTLNLFFGGSLSSYSGTLYTLALQTNGNGVSSLANAGLGGTSTNITFDTGFKPTTVITVGSSGATGTGILTGASLSVSVIDLTSSGRTSNVTAALNNALQTTAVGTTARPVFSTVPTGLELSIPLANLGYTPGTAINATAFFLLGSGGRTTNQILSPFAYGQAGSDYDYTYIDANRQFTNASDYPGNQYFTIPAAAAPEPSTWALLGVGAAGLGLVTLRRRRAGRA